MKGESLSDKIRITVDQGKMRERPEHIEYYEKYAVFVLETLNEPSFQQFLHQVIEGENIKNNEVRDIQVTVFPFKKENGKSLAGKSNKKGVIHIYPRRRMWCQKLLRNWEKVKVRSYITCRARVALIHELLHLKYLGRENKVRELTRRYFYGFIRHNTPNVQKEPILKEIFPSVAATNPCSYDFLPIETI